MASINRGTHLILDCHEHSFGFHMQLRPHQFCNPHVLELAIGIIARTPFRIQLSLFWRCKLCAYIAFALNADRERWDGSIVIATNYSHMHAQGLASCSIHFILYRGPGWNRFGTTAVGMVVAIFSES